MTRRIPVTKTGTTAPPVAICCYVHDRDAALFSRAFGIGGTKEGAIDWFLWQDKNLIGPERAFQHCWSLFPGRDVIILHPDMCPLPGDTDNSWYSRLLRYVSELPDAGIIACDLLFRSKTDTGHHAVQCAGGVFVDGDIEYIRGRGLSYDERFKLPRMVQWATFGGIYLRREAIDACGDFDARYLWAYIMDVDYSLEVRRRGFTIYQVPVNLIHDENGTTRDFLSQPAYLEKIARNHAVFREKWKGSDLLAAVPRFEHSYRLFLEARTCMTQIGPPESSVRS